MRRTMLLLTAMAVVVLLAGGVALAKNIKCPNRDRNLCVGTNQDDTMTGRNRGDIIKARGGADTVDGRGARDRINGGDGGDILDGGPGDDTLNGSTNGPTTPDALCGWTGADTLVESAGKDWYIFSDGWGRDTISGEETDTEADAVRFGSYCVNPDFDGYRTNLTINLTTGQAFETAAGTAGANAVTWTPLLIEDATGGFEDDTITGSTEPNFVHGSNGADNINVADGNGGDFVNCGGNDGDPDTVTKDATDNTVDCNGTGDTIITAP